MTNQELLNSPKDDLNSLDRQRQHSLHLAGLAQSCPACRAPVNEFAAAGIGIDEYDFGATRYQYVCPRCQAELEMVIPFVGFAAPWRWGLEHEWLRSQLEKAKSWDERERSRSGS